jgi:hypothetical protein
MGRFDISPELAEEWRGNYRSWCDQEGLPWADDVIRELQV